MDIAAKLEMTQRLISAAGAPAKFRRNGVDRDCIAFETNKTARDENGQVLNPLSVVLYVSPEGLTVDPDWQLDAYVDFDGVVRRQTAQPKKVAPNGTTLYWEIKVMA